MEDGRVEAVAQINHVFAVRIEGLRAVFGLWDGGQEIARPAFGGGFLCHAVTCAPGIWRRQRD